MDKFQDVLKVYRKCRRTLVYGLVTLLTASGERLFSSVVFKCPCSAAWNLYYGLVFLLGPALALFLLGCAFHLRVWCLFTRGCACARACSLGPTPVCMQLTVAVLQPPLIWITVALLGGDFFECLARGCEAMARKLCQGREPSCPAQLPLVPCDQVEPPALQDLRRELWALSQVLGWALIIISLLICVVITVCLPSNSYRTLKFWKIYLKKEHEIFKSQAKEHATKRAEDTVKCFWEDFHPEEHSTLIMKDCKQMWSMDTLLRGDTVI